MQKKNPKLKRIFAKWKAEKILKWWRPPCLV